MESLFNVTTLVNSLRRLWWVAVLTLILGCLVSIQFSRRLPRIYQANTLILVEPQKIPTNYVKPIVTTPIENRLKTIQQQVTSRSRMETIIREQNLFPALRDRVPMEDLVARVNRGMRLEVRGTSTFRIYYDDRDPKVAAQVANAVAELFINENIAARRAEARGTTEFLEVQLAEKKADLERQEALITDFNRRHLAELPAQRDANFRVLEGLRSRLQTTLDAVSKEEDRRIVLESQLAELPVSGGANAQTSGAQLDVLRQRLVELKGQYTEQHPEIVLIKRQISELERELTRQAVEKKDAAPEPAPVGLSLREVQLRGQIHEVEVKIRDHNREIERVKNQIADYESRVANAPRNEQMLLTLKRDYDIMQQSYLDLLKNKTQAVMAENLEQERQGEQFVVLDRAVPPVRPYKPNVQQIIAMGSAFGLFIGIGIALLFDIVRPRFRTEDELAAAYGIPVLVSIPAVVTGDETPWFSRHRKWIFGGMLVIFTGLVAVAYGALAG